jgi:thiamine biosynthesis lipoprotein
MEQVKDRNGLRAYVPLALAAFLCPSAGWAAERTTTASAAGSGAQAGAVARARVLMGTRLVIEIPGAPDEGIFQESFDEVARLEQILSNWRQSSEITRLNGAASRGPVRCSPDLFEAIHAALHWAEATEGAFDPTVEPIVRRLGLRQREAYLPAGPEDLAEGLAPVDPPAGERQERAPIGWRLVILDDTARTVRFSAPGVGIDLGAIGKGIALDAAARVLSRRGIRRTLLDFGGQVLAVGSPPGEPGWAVGVSDPDDRRRVVAVVRASDLSVSTSGNAERLREEPSGQAGHIIDPSRREPATFGGSVTVAAPDATSADALSTALFVMGPDAGGRWAAARGVAALFLRRTGAGGLERRATPAFERLMDQSELTHDTTCGRRDGGSPGRL